MSLRQSTIEFHSRLIELSQVPQSIEEYCRSIIDEQPEDKEFPGRLSMGRAVQALATEALGEFADGVGDLVLRAPTVVSFAEHHSPLVHPLTLSSVAVQTLYSQLSGARLISLTCASVPLDNELFPRGIVVAGQKLPFLPGRHRRRITLRCPPLDHEVFARNLERSHSAGALDGPTFAALRDWWAGLAPELATAGAFWQQISVLNRRLHEAVFDVDVPAPVMVPLESVAQRVLLDDLAGERDSWLERCMFRPQARAALIEALDGVRCFWRRSTGRGTFLFWHVGDDGRLMRLWPDDNVLIAAGDGVRYRLTPDVIRAGLDGGGLIPAASYSLLRLMFQVGLRSFGGPLQYDYVGNARRGLLAGLRHHLRSAERDAIVRLPLSYYVNFAEKKELHGELERVVNPIGRTDLARIAALRLDSLAREDVTWVDSELAQY